MGSNGQSTLTAIVFMTIVACVLQIEATDSDQFGSLRLCPAGGRSFMMAWNLACEMKRKKRSVPDAHEIVLGTMTTSTVDPVKMANEDSMKKRSAPEGYRPATLTEIMKICCQIGCEVRDLLAYCDPFGPWNS